ncbi:ribosomal protein L23-domain-containing protein [Sphaerosporella brunnea]|uniref:Large ribosomal subunit protein uL23m n=1 Tax=Sphaerosporella brunnea TaxID=1250544 RepID=A0A5J5EZJ3_9PEZI|nr:ribosomal protein L23-domain-containing protein [Sphaerosporella brunnea]
MPPYGSKPVFLPKFTISLLRTPHLPPNFAQFAVPLNINKLDLRDYLKHAYDVEVLSVRSFITQMKVQRTKPGTTGTNYYRPRSVKKMTVELVKPFVYPEEPKDLKPWDNELWKAIEKMRDEQKKTLGPFAYKEPNAERGKLRKLAEEALTEETTEVEKDVTISR